MKLTQTTSIKRKSGMTLIELTVVILVLLALIAVLFVGARAYKRGADKAACIMNLRNVQQACRSYYNLKPKVDASGVATPLAAIGDLAAADVQLIGAAPTCPAGGAYTFDNGAAAADAAQDGVANVFVKCDIADPAHVPADAKNW